MKLFSSFLLCCLLAVCSGSEAIAQQSQLPRIGIAGISIECSTFSPAVTPLEAFRQLEGEALLRSYPYLSPDSTMGKGANGFLPCFRAPLPEVLLRARPTRY